MMPLRIPTVPALPASMAGQAAGAAGYPSLPSPYRGQLEGLRITLKQDIPPHEFLYEWMGTPCFPRGELVGLTGKAKTGKTFFTSMLATAALEGTCMGILRQHAFPLHVLWIDTEQSESTTQEIMRDRIFEQVNEEQRQDLESYLDAFNLRRQDWRDRLYLVQEAIRMCHPDLVILDGVRDLIDDINNIAMAQTIIDALLTIVSEQKCCLVAVLHQNKAAEDKTMRGAIGTELLNKCFETYVCSREEQVLTVAQELSRKVPLPGKMHYQISRQTGLPGLLESKASEATPKNDLPTGWKDSDNEFICYDENGRPHYYLQKLILHLFVSFDRLRAWQVREAMMATLGTNSSRTVQGLIEECLRRELIVRDEVSPHEVYYVAAAGLKPSGGSTNQRPETDAPAIAD